VYLTRTKSLLLCGPDISRPQFLYCFTSPCLISPCLIFPCSAVRKINELVKRVRICKVHAYIISHLKEQMPMMMGFAKKQKEVRGKLASVYSTSFSSFTCHFPVFYDLPVLMCLHLCHPRTTPPACQASPFALLYCRAFRQQSASSLCTYNS
jgi:hypothetical protein